jgi:F-type H+-transporting ATPase subunit a
MSGTVQRFLPVIVIFNFALVAMVLIGLALFVTRRKLAEVPDPVQNAAEYILDWFVRLARDIRPDGVTAIAPFLASLFLFILFSNLLAVISFPVIKIPPTSYYSVTLALALIGTLGITVLNARFKGFGGAVKHLFWPNPLQLVSEASHALSLSLRLFGNIGGEFLVAALVVQAAPYGIPLIIHLLGLIPAVIQPMVFTLLISNFLEEAAHPGEERHAEREAAEATPTEPGTDEPFPEPKEAEVPRKGR